MSKGGSGNSEGLSRAVYSTEQGDLRKSKITADNEPAGKIQKGGPIRVSLDTKARKGKAVTLVTGIQHNPQVIAALAKELRTLCGAGGTVEGKDILVQGDHRDKIIDRLTQLGYKTKRIG